MNYFWRYRFLKIACSRGKFYNVKIIIFNFHKNGINNIIFFKSPKVGKKSFRTAWHNYILACQKWQKMTFYDNGTFTYIVNFAVATLVRTTSRDISATGSISVNLNNEFYTKIIKKPNQFFKNFQISHLEGCFKQFFLTFWSFVAEVKCDFEPNLEKLNLFSDSNFRFKLPLSPKLELEANSWGVSKIKREPTSI